MLKSKATNYSPPCLIVLEVCDLFTGQCIRFTTTKTAFITQRWQSKRGELFHPYAFSAWTSVCVFVCVSVCEREIGFQLIRGFCMDRQVSSSEIHFHGIRAVMEEAALVLCPQCVWKTNILRMIEHQSRFSDNSSFALFCSLFHLRSWNWKINHWKTKRNPRPKTYASVFTCVCMPIPMCVHVW